MELLPRLQDAINRAIGDLTENDGSAATATWAQAVDSPDRQGRFELYLDFPGLVPRKTELTLSGDRHETVSGARGGSLQHRRTERG